jgi:hypothetical protein
MLGNYQEATELVASRVVLSSIELPSYLECSDVVWIGLAQDRDRWRPLVNEVMNLRIPAP